VSAPFGGSRLLVDKSALARSARPAVAEPYGDALLAGQLYLAPVTELELLYSARDSADLERIEQTFGAYRPVDFGGSLWRVAVQAMRDLAALGPLHHHVALPDVLIAAAAQERQLGVLHYDAHYDRLARVLDFESVWIGPAGELQLLAPGERCASLRRRRRAKVHRALRGTRTFVAGPRPGYVP
jgi:predicted nucleic acid-binding protein